MAAQERMLWVLERAGHQTRCAATMHPEGLELRITGDAGERVWQEVFATQAALIVRATDGRARLEALGWQARPPAAPAPTPAAAPPAAERRAPDDAFDFLDQRIPPSARVDWTQHEPVSQPALTAPPTLFPPKCPECRSLNVFAAETLAFFAFKQLWLCAECKRTWRSIRWTKVLLVLATIVLVVLSLILI